MGVEGGGVIETRGAFWASFRIWLFRVSGSAVSLCFSVVLGLSTRFMGQSNPIFGPFSA